jgi:hypothetical protein
MRLLLGSMLAAQAALAGALPLPPATRGWETIPGVIRTDGLETFRLEVDANGPVARVTLDGVESALVPPSPPPLDLRDDGLGEDRVAGDRVFSAGPFRYDTEYPFLPAFYRGDPASPAGAHVLPVGTVRIEELDGTESEFVVAPQIGLLAAEVPETGAVPLSPQIVVSPHLINIRTDRRAAQTHLRFETYPIHELTQAIYDVLPDAFDFLIFFSTHRIERVPASARNYVKGSHTKVQVNYTGTGLPTYDESGAFGSAGRLLSCSILDGYLRGLSSKVAVHEIVHQWSGHISPSLGLTGDGPHYKPRSSVGSLVGGFRWIDNGDGTFSIDCDEGRGGAHRASPLDRYLMGLVPGHELPPLHVYSETSPDPAVKCHEEEPVLPHEIVTTVRATDIQRTDGVRLPGPADTQREFAIGFVAESHERFLNATERTFYETFAAHFTQPVEAGEPDPYVDESWPPMTRFFGEETTWRSALADAWLEIDIRPGVDANPIQPSTRGVVAVVIFSSALFDVADLDPDSLGFGPHGAPPIHDLGEGRVRARHIRDRNGDGLLDLVCHFRAAQTGIAAGDARACVRGATRMGIPFEACDRLRTLPPER